MKAEIDNERCSGCGLCSDACPDVFEMDDETGKAVVALDDIPFALENDCVAAADACPDEAIWFTRSEDEPQRFEGPMADWTALHDFGGE